MSNARKKSQPSPARDPWKVLRAAGWLVLAGTWLFLLLCLVSYDAADWPGHRVAPYNDPPMNWAGPIGAVVAHECFLMLGPGVWALMAGVGTYLVATGRRRAVSHPLIRLAGLLVMTVALSAMLNLVVVASSGVGGSHLTGPFDGLLPGAVSRLLPGADRPEGAGGLIAIYLNSRLLPGLNVVGTFVLLGVVLGVGAVVAADEWALALPRLLARATTRVAQVRLPARVGGRVASATGAAVSGAAGGVADAFDRAGSGVGRSTRRTLLGLWPRRSGAGRRAADESGEDRAGKADRIDEGAGGIGGTESFDPNDDAGTARRSSRRPTIRGRTVDEAVPDPDAPEDAEEEAIEVEVEHDAGEEGEEGSSADPTAAATGEEGDAGGDADAESSDVGDAPGTYVAEKKQFSPAELREKMRQLPINFAPRREMKAPPPREVDFSGYQFPGLDLLVEPETDFTEEQEKMVREQAVFLESALQEYRIEGEVVGIDSGPVITLFEVRLAPGTKVSRLNNVASDLARALKAVNIRIVPNMVGKDTVGVEVPNLKKERVRLKELMTTESEAVQKMRLPMFLGKDTSGNPLVADLAAMPHMLIAGTTGSGKSVCMNSIIMSFLYTRRPDELKLVLVDPKMVEMSMFRDIPHLMCPVVTEMDKAAAILEWAVTKMDERYELLAEAGVRDIAGYNSLDRDELLLRFNPSNEMEEAKIPKKLPFLVFVIDELADLMMTNKEVEGFIVRIAQKARAVGIHLILATQRPQANVVTGLIKSNMPCRVSFKVASGMDSRIVLDQKGAELLLGQGDMLYLSPRTSKLSRSQGTLVDDMEIRKVVRFLRDIAEQNFEPSLMQLKQPGLSAEEDEERDPLFDDAVRVVLQTRRGSVSLLQRRLTIGYSRASRLIEQMSMAGIIGEYKGSQAREVNLTVEEWEAIRAQAEADAAAEEGLVDPTRDPADTIEAAEAEEEMEADEEWDDDEDGEDDDDRVDLEEGMGYEDEDEDED